MSQTKYSLIITVKDDAEALKKLLSDIETQSELPDEVILTVVPSKDESLKIAQNWKPTKIRSKVIELEPETTRATGRNKGREVAQGNVLCFTDAGCLLSPSWFEKIVHAFSLPETKLVSGFTQSTTETPQEEVQGAYTLVSLSQIETHPLPATRNMAVRAEIFDLVGPFNPELNYAEDYEWSRRARKKGVHATFVPDAKVWWKPRQTWQKFWLMVFRLTCGDMHAQTWRAGHLSMWLRYAVLAFLSWQIGKLAESFVVGLLSLLVLWFLYVGIKMIRFTFQHRNSYFFVPLAQLLTDSAVLFGIIVGLLQKWQHIKAERRKLHA